MSCGRVRVHISCCDGLVSLGVWYGRRRRGR
ncbi:hypothetical protein TSAR_000667 [Trichomalopsis sarcophagae]|uniref:Uncharacterized protein n=1 Tax=Trichomalopsis sarcophagae TaxID=543379 RepID=A0A232F2L2_9HYME|nr:hypothetical protein TSAR_000667 [Trichomalopsis sarcophagae]